MSGGHREQCDRHCNRHIHTEGGNLPEEFPSLTHLDHETVVDRVTDHVFSKSYVQTHLIGVVSGEWLVVGATRDEEGDEKGVWNEESWSKI